jgi:hypothetical protein
MVVIVTKLNNNNNNNNNYHLKITETIPKQYARKAQKKEIQKTALTYFGKY